jgi:Uma2 family endonuclease
MGEPAWAIATLFPSQGSWSEEAYLGFSAERPSVELVQGTIEVLPVPTDQHQRVQDAIYVDLLAYAQQTGGRARTAGIRVRLASGLFRQPDVVFLSVARLQLRGEDYWSGADLVVEIVSGSAEDRVRDLVIKRREYAKAAIPEYWIVQPDDETITVLQLAGDAYHEHGVFRRGGVVTSPTCPGLQVAVNRVLDAD